jgi:hypothetical protein
MDFLHCHPRQVGFVNAQGCEGQVITHFPSRYLVHKSDKYSFNASFVYSAWNECIILRSAGQCVLYSKSLDFDKSGEETMVTIAYRTDYTSVYVKLKFSFVKVFMNGVLCKISLKRHITHNIFYIFQFETSFKASMCQWWRALSHKSVYCDKLRNNTNIINRIEVKATEISQIVDHFCINGFMDYPLIRNSK